MIVVYVLAGWVVLSMLTLIGYNIAKAMVARCD